jgi:hypothetical protein
MLVHDARSNSDNNTCHLGAQAGNRSWEGHPVLEGPHGIFRPGSCLCPLLAPLDTEKEQRQVHSLKNHNILSFTSKIILLPSSPSQISVISCGSR